MYWKSHCVSLIGHLCPMLLINIFYFYSNSLDEERKKNTSLVEALTLEQVNTSQLQSELDAEKSRNHTNRQRNQHIIEVK